MPLISSVFDFLLARAKGRTCMANKMVIWDSAIFCHSISSCGGSHYMVGM